MFNFRKLAALSAATVLAAVQLTAGTAFAAANLNDNEANAHGVAQSNNSDKTDNKDNTPGNDQPSTPGNNDNKDKKDETHEKVRICHATHSDTNAYVSIEVDRNAADGIAGNSGNQADHYSEHQGPVFDTTKDKKDQPDWGDIIPALIGGHNGLNWTTDGQAIWNNNCDIPQSNTPGNPGNNPPSVDQVTLCHATGSNTNPFVVITIDAAGAYNGHMGHQDNEDIIPPFTYQGTQYSLNWTSAGQAAWNNNCVPVGGMGSGPTTTDPQSPVADPADPATAAPKLANTGSDIWISSLISLTIIAISAVLGFVSRRKLTVA